MAKTALTRSVRNMLFQNAAQKALEAEQAGDLEEMKKYRSAMMDLMCY